jgi:vacuolar-type H+-ATPase subunit H
MSSSVVIRRNEMDALYDAADIIEAAHKVAKGIIEQAQGEAQKIHSDSRSDAMTQVLTEARGLLTDLRSLREEVAEQSVEVAQSILQKAWEILGSGIKKSDKLKVALEQASRYFVSTSAMKLRVNPEMVTDTQAWLDVRRQEQPGLELLTIEPDLSVRPDEVRLYLDRGGVIRADFVGTLEILKAQWS